MRLLSRTLAAQEWGWRNGLQLRSSNAEERMGEILAYVASHHKPGRKWVAAPQFQDIFRREAMTDDAEELYEVYMSGPALGVDLKFKKDISWNLRSRMSYQLPYELVRSRQMYSIEIRFPSYVPHGNRQHSCIIFHQVDEDNQGFYYLHLMGWICRSSDLCECLAILDAMEANHAALLQEYNLRLFALDFYRDLNEKILVVGDDEPRRAYLQRTMDGLVQEYAMMEYFVLDHQPTVSL